MNEPANQEKPGRLSDAYQVRGFRVHERLKSYELDRRIFVLAMKGRSKKRRGAAVAENAATGFTISAGAALAILVAGVGTFFLISRCGA